MTAKPPVPSNSDIQRILADGPFGPPGSFDSYVKVWLAGYNARDAQLDIFWRESVARLEAEVAELREQVEDMRGRAESKLHQAADALQDQVLGRLPRRTPELTERVAQWLFDCEPNRRFYAPWDDIDERQQAIFRKKANALLDLVLGKEPSDG